TRRGMRRGSTSGRGRLIFPARYAAVPARCRRRHDGLPCQDFVHIRVASAPAPGWAPPTGGGLVAVSVPSVGQRTARERSLLPADCAARMKTSSAAPDPGGRELLA